MTRLNTRGYSAANITKFSIFIFKNITSLIFVLKIEIEFNQSKQSLLNLILIFF